MRSSFCGLHIVGSAHWSTAPSALTRSPQRQYCPQSVQRMATRVRSPLAHRMRARCQILDYVDVVKALIQFGGAARREQLGTVGVSQTALARAVSIGAVRRYHRGCYAIPDSAPSTRIARALRGQVTCISARPHWGLPELVRERNVHVAVPSHRGVARAPRVGGQATHVHHSVHVTELTSVTVQPWVAIDHMGRCAAPLAQLVAVDAALNRGLMTLSKLDEFTVTETRRTRWLARRASGSAESLLETLTRVALIQAGLAVSPQAVIAGVGRVDLLVEGIVVVELDGRAYHSDEAAFAADRKRDRALALAGYTVLRFTYHEVMLEREQVVADVLAAVRAARSRLRMT